LSTGTYLKFGTEAAFIVVERIKKSSELTFDFFGRRKIVQENKYLWDVISTDNGRVFTPK